MSENQPLQLSDEQLEHLVERVTEKVIENVYTSVGKSVVTKFFWFVGVAAIGIVTFLAGVGHIKIGS
jgi:hypothetical protein